MPAFYGRLQGLFGSQRHARRPTIGDSCGAYTGVQAVVLPQKTGLRNALSGIRMEDGAHAWQRRAREESELLHPRLREGVVRVGSTDGDRAVGMGMGIRGKGQLTQRGPARRGASPLVREALCGQIGRDVVRLASDPAAAPAGRRRGRSAPIVRRTAHRRAGRAHAARRRSRSHRGWRWRSPSSCQRC